MMRSLLLRSCHRTVLKHGPRSLQTAAEAAAHVSYTRGLFLGITNTKRAFPYPKLSESEMETLQMLVDPVSKFFNTVDSRSIDETKEIPSEVLNDMKELGLFGLQIPEEFEGLGLSNTGYARVCEEITDGSLAVTVMAHQSIGLKGILLNGNEAQKAKYLPKLATGEHIAAFALTEPSSGSDAGSIKTRATLSDDGSYFILNGGKIWISNGGWADVMTVFAQTEVDGKDKVTAFIVERAFGGVTSGPPEDKLGIRGSNTCQVFFDNCKVPIENVLGGGPDMKTGGASGVGEGFKVAMNILNNGRFGLGACAGASLRRVLGVAAEHANSRKQFGAPLASFGLIQKKFGVMALEAYAIESMAFMTTGMIDRGDPSCEIEAAMCKVYGSEVAFTGINECIQVMGGTGFMKEWPFERLMRDCRILSIFEGTNEILRMLIALSGIKTAGERLSAVGKVLQNPLSDPSGAAKEIADRLQRKFSPSPLKDVHSSLNASADLLLKRTTAFGDAVEFLLRKHGKQIVNEQMQLERIADSAIALFAMTATISRSTASLNAGIESAKHEKKLTTLYCDLMSRKIQSLLNEIKTAGKHDEQLREIAHEVLKAEKYIPSHATGINC
ncbi:acyl-dehydrogenase family member mitochondrial [Plasmopara halstedii]|uniref:Acyl-dehydrogenase family member mitochondrial n=1 Tax=Plasmopara halstedii TaxID=4781 RepID=A0A0P1ASA0_PLAHL|nr:acyl-dehydrogenase family member mitochondrial [Plasmopara halstedii]CEG44834.1 acyl-dehydrogenase family member mitochondrial [Plasmopara halstedii]|eukprot:XP_024581203.1 acyl-dehydrogenase family member mitochondrial [Plasmopara halstedii]